MASLTRAKNYLAHAKASPTSQDKIDSLIQAVEELIKVVSDVEDTAEKAKRDAGNR